MVYPAAARGVRDLDEGGTILIVEDDQAILRTNRRILEREGFSVLSAETLAEARAHLRERRPDVLVLDIRLPDGSGLDFCVEIRGSTPAPVLFLTALDETREVIAGLLAGGNDYITKPYDVDEFVARVKAQLRLARMNLQSAQEDIGMLTLGALTLDVVAQRATLGGSDLLLTPKEFVLLHYLVRHEGQTVKTRQVYESLWRQPLIDDVAALKNAVSRLRKKLDGSGYTIVSVRGEGYRLEKEW